MKYLGLDGDSIGRHIERLLIEEELDELENFSKSVKASLKEIEKLVNQNNGKVIFSGGDSILFRGEFDLEFAIKILKVFYQITGRTASIGFGNNTSEAYLGLKLAKSKGGNQVVDYGQIKKKNQI